MTNPNLFSFILPPPITCLKMLMLQTKKNFYLGVIYEQPQRYFLKVFLLSKNYHLK